MWQNIEIPELRIALQEAEAEGTDFSTAEEIQAIIDAGPEAIAEFIAELDAAFDEVAYIGF